MYALYIFLLTIHAVFSTSPCHDGIEIGSRVTRNPADLIGNWSYVYHWDSINQFKEEFSLLNYHQPMTCSGITIRETTPDFIQKKQAECYDAFVPFNWLEARLIWSPENKGFGDDAVVFIGKTGSWMMLNCKRILRIEMRMVYDNYMVFMNRDVGSNTYMMARQIPSFEELKCVAHNVDVGKGLSGLGLCV